MSEYAFVGPLPSCCANIHVPNSPVWKRLPGYSRSNGHAATYIEKPALNVVGHLVVRDE